MARDAGELDNALLDAARQQVLSVMCGASIVVGDRDRAILEMGKQRRQSSSRTATSMRPSPACSERCSAWVQNPNSDE